MAFADIAAQIENATQGAGFPVGASDRYKRLDAYDRLLEGTFYDHITVPFEKETEGNQYISVMKRRPSIIESNAKDVVEAHASLTFGEAHFPTIRCASSLGTEQTEVQKKTELACAALVKGLKLAAVMEQAIIRGSTGSACLIAKVDDDGQASIDVISGKNAKPILKRTSPGKMGELERIWSVTGQTLLDFGYEIPDGEEDTDFWLRVVIDKATWTWYKPLRDIDYAAMLSAKRSKDEQVRKNAPQWIEDTDLSGEHGFDRLPVVWLRNLLIGDDAIDGLCTFGQAVDEIVAVDYGLSQRNRGVRYSMDPLLVINTGEMGSVALSLAQTAGGDGIVKSAANALPLFGKDSKAELLEITGKGFEVASEEIEQLREAIMRTCGGMRSTVEKANGAPQSGRALELLYQNVVWYVERLRVCYGDSGLLPLLRILLAGLADGLIDLQDGEDWKGIDPEAPLTLVWPKWWLPRGSDMFAEVQALDLLAGGSVKVPAMLIAPEEASKYAAQLLDLDDPVKIAKDAQGARDDRDAKALAEAQQQAELTTQSQTEVAKAKAQAAGGAAGKGD